MIYDKNQFSFNLIFLFILIASIIINIIFGQNFVLLNQKMQRMEQTLVKIEDNQNNNFVQGAHQDIEFQLTSQGFFIPGVNDYGLFNGPSMQPAVFDGNTLIQIKYEGGDLLEGQIIRFLREDGQAVIHRVRADYGSTIFVQGDSLNEGEIIIKDRVTHIIVGVLFT